jgi:restriction system protein
MQKNEPRDRAEEILKLVLSKVLRPLAWALAAPAAALRRSRASMEAHSQSAERAKFDSRKWTPELLKHLEWRRLEELCAAYFEAAGFKTRIAHSRPDGGVELSLCAESAARASAIVHCKAWDAYRVGIKPVRELRAAMSAAGVDKGMLVTTGRFTQEAARFAAAENIQLIDGAGLLANFDALDPEKALALLKFTTQGDFLTPTCPGCSIKMTTRKSTQGGRKYWGCTNYPRCKETLATAVFAH